MIFNQPHLICSFSRRPPNMSLSYGDTTNSLENRKNFLEGLGIDFRDLVCAEQIHAGYPRHVSDIDKGKGALSCDTALPDTDALVTERKNLPLAVFTADCLSIFLYDSITNSIGIIHAGWRSSRENITLKTIQLMQDKFNTRPKDLYVGFGPAIRPCCYGVGKEFSDYFSDNLIKRNGNYYLDLVAVNKKQLLDSGVKDLNIFDPKICTSCRNKEFFSYRREGKSCGRIMSVIMLK